ncbi:hypothetical protein J6590_024436 [Homalodisca vitripennis]|nr:hypothetical protein J6590_024436 [Homalodisca vitripennis]
MCDVRCLLLITNQSVAEEYSPSDNDWPKDILLSMLRRFWMTPVEGLIKPVLEQ